VGALIVVAYATWAVSNFVYESWRFNELAQGLLQIPIWMPQMSLVAGCVVLLIAVLEDLIAHLGGRKTAYQAAEDARHAQADFSDRL
jgi:TRAP-type C4-dicarboxylate transport system permease small subunit